jgi:energy-converting hydrogenase Eha subunit G
MASYSKRLILPALTAIAAMQLAPSEILINADVAFDEGVDEVAAVEAIEASIVRVVPSATRIFIEPTRR